LAKSLKQMTLTLSVWPSVKINDKSPRQI